MHALPRQTAGLTLMRFCQFPNRAYPSATFSVTA
jgi:hypothetical protein